MTRDADSAVTEPTTAQAGSGATARAGSGATAQTGSGTTPRAGSPTTARAGSATTARSGSGTTARADSLATAPGGPDRPDSIRRTATWLRGLSAAGLASLAFVALVVVAAMWPGLLAPGSPTAVAPTEAFEPPSASAIFGTDSSGRDVYTRVVYGAGQSLGIGLAATAIGLTVGVVLGFASALGPRWLDGLLSRVIEVLFALPSLVLALLLVAVMGAGVRASVIAVGVATAPGYARILRARARSVARSPYVHAARLEGVASPVVFVRHVLPNTVWPLIALATLGIGQAIVWVSALSYLGLGALPPSPEWGAMLNDGRLYISSAWWLTVAPGLAITATATALTVLGRRLSSVAPA